MTNTPEQKHSKVLGIVKESLMIIFVEVDYILREEELTDLCEKRVKEIRRQAERASEAMKKGGN